MQHPKTRGGIAGSAGKIKTSGANRDSAPSRSPKVVDRRLLRAPASELREISQILQKKRANRVPELESQVAQLQEELKRATGKLGELESWKEAADEAKKQLAAMSAKLEESQRQLDEFWACEESRIQELRKLSQDRDRAWESELKAVQKHHSMDSAALAAAMNENQKLKIQLQKVVESEATQAKHAESAHNEALKVRLELSETLDLVEELKTQLNDSRDSEARALELISQTREQLEMVKQKAEKDAGKLVEETDESGGQAGRAMEQLGLALAANADMEGELRRLKVQAEQWKKAAEAAAAMVLGDGGGGVVESLDFHALGEKVDSPYSEDMEDEPSNKKNNNVLKKLGILLKKTQK